MQTAQTALTARVHEASLTTPDQLDCLFCVAEIEPFGRLRTQSRSPSNTAADAGLRCSWEEVSGASAPVAAQHCSGYGWLAGSERWLVV